MGNATGFPAASSQLHLNSVTFPEISGTFSLTFPDLMAQIIYDVCMYRMKFQAKRGQFLIFFFLQPLGVYKDMPKNQGPNLVQLSQIIFPDSLQKY